MLIKQMCVSTKWRRKYYQPQVYSIIETQGTDPTMERTPQINSAQLGHEIYILCQQHVALALVGVEPSLALCLSS